MPDDRPIVGEDAEPNPESELGARTVGDAAGPVKPPGGSGATPRRRRHPRARRHEDDNEAYDAIDEGPVEVHPAAREMLYLQACNDAELAGFG